MKQMSVFFAAVLVLYAALLQAKTPPLHIPAGAEWLEIRHHFQCEKMAEWGDQIEVMMVGDSITHLWTWDKPNDPANEPYRGDEVWAKWFGEPKYFNFAFDGGNWQSTLAHLDAAPLGKIDPKVAVILVGINNLRAGDSPESVADGIVAVEEKFRKTFPKIKILQLAIFPSGEKSDDPIRIRVNETNRILKERIAGKEDILFLDIGPKLLLPDGTISPEIMPDFLHVNPKGFEIWGEEMKPVLDSLLLSVSSRFTEGGIQIPDSEKALYRIANWDDTDRGSHRAVISVPENLSPETESVSLYIPWRRRDRDFDQKGLILTDEAGTQIDNFKAFDMTRESVRLLFEPISGSGIYYLYYLPHTVQPGHGYYSGNYLLPKDNSDSEWVSRNAPNGTIPDATPRAELTALEARDKFESFYPMEVIAKDTERESLIALYADRPFLLFPEDREHPIVLVHDIPLRWIENGPGSVFTGTAERNEYYAFQIGLFAANIPVQNVAVQLTDLVSEDGVHTIPADKLTCFNLGGINSAGQPFTKRIDLEKGDTQALWFGVDIAEDTVPGVYIGKAAVSGENLQEESVEIRLTVTDTVIPDRGDNDPERFSRLRWLNSTLGIDDHVYPPFTPLTIDNGNIGIVGRQIRYAENGLPKQIVSEGNELLAAPIRFLVTQKGGKSTELSGDNGSVTESNTGMVKFAADTKPVQEDGIAIPVSVRIESRLDFDGYMRFKAELTALESIELDDIALEIPMTREKVPYLMGLGQNGGFRPDSCRWEWGGKVYYDSFWLGDVHGGLQCELRGANYAGPMVNLYWPIGQLTPPDTWFNGGNGFCEMRTEGETVTVKASSGSRHLEAGESIPFEWTFIVTPVKPLDPAKQFGARYFHSDIPVDVVKKSGATVINIHHATPINLYINYPFLASEALSAHVRRAHEAGMKVKIYYTVRELTNHITEWAAIRSLGTEVLADGQGGGYPWLREHFEEHYTPAWYDRLDPKTGETPRNPEVSAAVVTSGDSRWLNYYVEGLRWLLTHIEIDGIYLDDVSYDRLILKRLRSVMEEYCPGSMIDLHSNTAFSFNPANQYLEFLPYIDKIWFGESFDYEGTRPDYWLTEISGIPYGVMGEMLQNGGNPWRGFVYGMTSRLPWVSGKYAVCITEMWRLWDNFGIGDAQIAGYWEKDPPVKTDQADVPVTSYIKDGKTLIALASWNPEPVECRLIIDWNRLGFDPAKTVITAPEMRNEFQNKDGSVQYDGFQPGKTFRLDEPIPAEPGKGWVLILSEKE